MNIKLIFFVAVLFLTACGDSEYEASLLLGEEVVKKTCKVCHAQGINGAPIIGNQKMWGSRPAKGIDQLVANASNGYGLMPAKGGNEELSDVEIRAAVSYMLEQLEP